MSKLKHHANQATTGLRLVLASRALTNFFKLISRKTIVLVMVGMMILVSNSLIKQKLMDAYAVDSAGKVEIIATYHTAVKNQTVGFHQADTVALSKQLKGLSAGIVPVVQTDWQLVGATIGQTSTKFRLTKLTAPTKLALVAGKKFSEHEINLGEHGIIISSSLAKRYFKSNQAALGQAVSFNGFSYRIVAVANNATDSGWIPAKAVMSTTNKKVVSQIKIAINDANDVAKAEKIITNWLSRYGKDHSQGSYTLALPNHKTRVISTVLLVINRLSWWLLLSLLVLIVVSLLQTIVALSNTSSPEQSKLFSSLKLVGVSCKAAWLNIVLGWIFAAICSRILLDISFEDFFSGRQMYAAILWGLACWAACLGTAWWYLHLGRFLPNKPTAKHAKVRRH